MTKTLTSAVSQHELDPIRTQGDPFPEASALLPSTDVLPADLVEAIEESPVVPSMDTSPVLFTGGTSHDQSKNHNALAYIQAKGRTVLDSIADRNLAGIPSGHNRVRRQIGEVILGRWRTHLHTADPEVISISRLTQESRADEIIEHVEKQPEPITLISQSADAQNGVIATHRRPDLIKNLVLLFPSGLMKKQTRTDFTRQTITTIREGRKPSKPVIEPDNNFDTPLPESRRERTQLKLARFIGSGGSQALLSTITGYQGGLLHELRQRDDPPSVAMVLGTNDVSMRPDKIIRDLISPDDADFILIVNSAHGVKGRKDLMDEVLRLTDLMSEQRKLHKKELSQGRQSGTKSLEDKLIFLDEGSYKVPKQEQERLREIARKK